jgi:hypothetical protein
VRLLVIAIVMCAASAASAGPYDVGWATVGFSLGASPHVSGDIAGRVEREPCDTTCPLSSRMAIGGGIGRLGFELQIASSPVEDAGAMDYRDRSRHALRVGPVVRYTAFRRFGFDLSVRAGVQLGVLSGDETTTSMADPSCPIGREGMCDPIEMTYEPDSYSLVALPLGATLRLGVREPGGRGYFGVFADLDYTLVRIGFPGDARTGALRTMTYGFMFGTVFDLR